MEKKGIVAIVLALLVVILLGVALIGTWWTRKGEGTATGYSYKEDFGLQEAHVKKEAAGMKMETTTKYSDNPEAATSKVYNNVFYITIVALVLGIIGLITAIVAGVGKLSAKIAGIFLILTFIFALVAPIYFAAVLPGAMHADLPEWNKGFTGSEDLTYMDMTGSWSWGPGYGWYLAVVAFIVALIGAILAFRAKKPKAAVAAPTPPAP
ncbi:MAG: hypothetical protein QME47_00735 [Candidatus Thermoplasmatota archaeon]|nr:hypothetical protein [Candidatus Thermoplasmatota archaeon]